MDIINHLARTVTPAVLGDNRTPQNESLLEQFYAIFAGRLADNDTYGRFSGQEVARDDLGFYDRVWTDQTHRTSISRELAKAHNVDESSVQGLVAAAAPLAYHEISSLAGTTPVPQFLRDNLSTYRDHIPVWATTLVPAGLLAAQPAPAAGHRISDTVSTAPLQREEEKGGSFMKALLPIIGLIILGALAWALLKGCQENPEPVATPVVTEQVAEGDNATAVAADIEPASLRLATGEDNTLYACRINAGDEALKDQIMDAVRSVFGDEADKCRADIDDGFATDMPAAASLATILPIVKNSPNASMIIKGDQIVVNSPDAAALQQLVSDIQAAAPGMTVVAEGPLDLQNEIDNSLTASGAAMDGLGENPDPRDVARALSLQVINFEVDKALIPDVNKPLLDRAAEIMKAVPDMQLMIMGHTDSQASDAYNMELSRDRAEAVKEYLVSKGVDASKLQTKGMGETDPIADNSTEQGRFRNRRIEFTVYDESMAADNNGIAVTAGNDGDVGMGTTAQAGAASAAATVGNAATKAGNAVKNAGNAALNADPDLNPLDSNNDDLLPDSDDPTQGTALDPKAKTQ
ncbi:OmpA family protein [Psychrobacter arenosus]|uniref:OmpA family protein n=1 Tax=Psychrobacter arenosus TaxID=256326 RepID=UPI001918B414|nr:OmpA family protein [Psychrobacter arenosus]